MARQINEVIKGIIIGMHRSGKSAREISRILQLSHSTISRWINRNDTTGSTSRLKGSGRPKILNVTEAQQIIAASVDNPFLNSAEIRHELKLEVTSRTVRNTLREARLFNRVAVRKPALSLNQRARRLEFARKYANWTPKEWGSVLFTDESTIQSYKNSSVRVYRPKGQRFDQKYVKNLQRSGRVCVSVWSCLSAKGLGILHRIPGHLNADKYCDILEHTMLPDVLEHHFEDGCFLFQQDNCAVHTSGVVKRWIEEHELMVLDWPSNSADLNPIENVWAVWKEQINYNRIPNSNDLFARAARSWEDVKTNSSLVSSLFNSMPRRLQEVIEKNGHYTSY